MSLTLKLGSLAIRTLAKPLANYIKQNAREHDRFRHLCVNFAQRLHKIDIRLRLGLLQDNSVVDRTLQREISEAEKRYARTAAPTAKTKEQTKFDEEKLRNDIKKLEERARQQPRIRPLSENKAIETGANFISESFLFCVAGGIIVFEYFRQKRKEAGRRDDMKDRLDMLDTRIGRIETAVGVPRLSEPALFALSLQEHQAIDERDPEELVEERRRIAATTPPKQDQTQAKAPEMKGNPKVDAKDTKDLVVVKK